MNSIQDNNNIYNFYFSMISLQAHYSITHTSVPNGVTSANEWNSRTKARKEGQTT